MQRNNWLFSITLPLFVEHETLAFPSTFYKFLSLVRQGPHTTCHFRRVLVRLEGTQHHSRVLLVALLPSSPLSFQGAVKMLEGSALSFHPRLDLLETIFQSVQLRAFIKTLDRGAGENVLARRHGNSTMGTIGS